MRSGTCSGASGPQAVKRKSNNIKSNILIWLRGGNQAWPVKCIIPVRTSNLPCYAWRKAWGDVMWNRIEFLVSTDEWAKVGPVDVDTDSPILDIFWVVFIVLAVACAVAWRMRLINRR